MKCVPDIVYQSPHGLSLDLYVPDTLRAEACVIYAHGGGFRKGSKSGDEVAHFAKRFTDNGFALASVSYRLDVGLEAMREDDAQAVMAAQQRSAKVGLTLSDRLYGPAYHAAVEDISDAICYLEDEAASLGIASSKIGVMGVSAGGIAALGTAFAPRHMVDHVFEPAAVVTIASALVQPWRMRGDGPPCLLINGPYDRVVGIENARLGLTRADGLGAPFQLIDTGEVGHMRQVDVVLDHQTADGTPYFDLILAHFAQLKR